MVKGAVKAWREGLGRSKQGEGVDGRGKRISIMLSAINIHFLKE